MISFNETYEFTDDIPGCYSETELRRLYELVVGLPDGATIVEIGVLYGRSASIYLQVAKSGKPLNIHLVDPWAVSESDTYSYFHDLIDRYFRDVPFTMHNCLSEDVSVDIREISLLHVDGDHSPEGIETDCDGWLHLVNVDGVVVFHDYGAKNPDGSLLYPQIKAVVDDYCSVESDWMTMGVVDSQAAYHKL